MNTPTRLAWNLATLLSVGVTCAYAHEDDDEPRSGKAEKLGDVNFPVSCNPTAQKEFNRAMALFHSFWFDPAKASFKEVLKHDSVMRHGVLGSLDHGQDLR